MSDISTKRHSPSRLRRLLTLFSLGVLALVFALTAGVLYLNWRGHREWEQFKSEWEAKGEKFTVADFIPAAVPEDQNFAAAPMFAGLLDFTKVPGQPVRWNNSRARDRASAMGAILQNKGSRKAPPTGQWQAGAFVDLVQWQQFLSTNAMNAAMTPQQAAKDVLAVLGKFDSEFDELSSASKKQFAVFPLDYKENFRMLLPHLASMKGMSQTLRLRAVARLVAGQKDEALQDVVVGLRMADALKAEPTLISQLVRIAMLQQAIQPVWEGVARHDWSDGHLIRLQAALSGVRLLEDYGRTIRSERAFGNAAIDELRAGKTSLSSFGESSDDGNEVVNGASRLVPSGWYRRNQVTLNRLYQERFLPLVDAEKHRVYLAQAREMENFPELQKTGLYNFFARMLLPALGKTAAKFANGQVAIDLSSIACALERYRLAHAEYPAQLDLLVPSLIERIPVDPINGELPKYRREAGGAFVLYSIGWNEVDDDGQPGLTKSGGSIDSNRGDWVWRIP